MINDKLNEIFDIEPISITKKEVETALVVDKLEENEKLSQDIDNVRKTQYELLERGRNSVDDLISFAKETDSLRAWEAVNSLIKTTSEVAKSLADTVIEKHKTITPKNETTNNILFTGTTEELQKFLTKNKNNK